MASPAELSPGPLSPGNVVSAGLRLYRDRFKTYLKLSVQAYLWVLVPVYGWAQYFMLTGVMSRLAFQELINQPETAAAARQQIKPRLWSFLGLGILMLLIVLGAYGGLGIVGGLAGLVFGLIVGGILNPIVGSDIATGFGFAGGFLMFLGIFLLGLIWLVARLLIAEVPLAVEVNITASNSISRSWELSKQSVLRIQFVVIAAFLITLPVILVTNALSPLTSSSLAENSPALFWALYVLSLGISIVGNMLILPFWQTVKGVLYYDLRCRREGLDLQA